MIPRRATALAALPPDNALLPQAGMPGKGVCPPRATNTATLRYSHLSDRERGGGAAEGGQLRGPEGKSLARSSIRL